MQADCQLPTPVAIAKCECESVARILVDLKFNAPCPTRSYANDKRNVTKKAANGNGAALNDP